MFPELRVLNTVMAWATHSHDCGQIRGSVCQLRSQDIVFYHILGVRADRGRFIRRGRGRLELVVDICAATNNVQSIAFSEHVDGAGGNSYICWPYSWQ